MADDGMKKLEQAWNDEMKSDPGIPLWEKGKTPNFKPEYGQPEPSLVPYTLHGQGSNKRGAVIVCPGGAFIFKAPYEGRPVAQWLNSQGIHAFVLDYRLQPYLYWDIVGDAKRAIRLARYRASDWNIDPDKIGILGFSAGGQLTVAASTLFDEGDPSASDPIERVSSRPNAQIPCYPAVELHKIEHKIEGIEPYLDFFGHNPSEEVMRLASASSNVKANTPPAFLWGTTDDFLYNQWMPYLDALKEKGVPREFHIFAHGPHGMGLAEEDPSVGQWKPLCAAWLKSLGF